MNKTTAKLAHDALSNLLSSIHPRDLKQIPFSVSCARSAIEALKAYIVQPVAPGIKQLTAQMHGEQKWTVAEQQQRYQEYRDVAECFESFLHWLQYKAWKQREGSAT
jgi:hypothetical protein